MIPGRTERLKTFPYIGRYRYFVTICTATRHSAFTNPDVVEACRSQLLHSAAKHEFEVIAYCFMPDHMHLLVLGISDTADFRAFIVHFKKLTGFAYSQSRSGRLWQPGYYDHVLRHDEGPDMMVQYILENPIRAGLAKAVGE